MFFDKNAELERDEVIISYYNGADAHLVNGKLHAVKYNTGDWVWFVPGKGENEYNVKSILSDMGVMYYVEKKSSGG